MAEILARPKIDLLQAQDELLKQLELRRDDIAQFRERLVLDGDDLVYRFFHQSFKVYRLQAVNREAVEFLETFLKPEHERGFDFQMRELIAAGAGNIEFKDEHNLEWGRHTRPFVELYLHVKHILDCMLEAPEAQKEKSCLTIPFATVLSCFNLR